MTTKRKKVIVSMQKKLEAISRIEKGEALKSIASEYGVGISTVSDWRKNKSNIEEFCAKMVSKENLKCRSTTKKAKNESLDDALFLWFMQEREHGVPMSGPIIQQKALTLNKLLGGDPWFSASVGWLGRWKDRHGIRQNTFTGESLHQDIDSNDNCTKAFRQLVVDENLTPSQIYIANKAKLFYNMLPHKLFPSTSDDKPLDHKKSLEHVTLLVCSNATGTHKLPLVIVGKSAKPKALKHVNFQSLPGLYRSQKSATISEEIFKNWFFDNFVPSVQKQLENEGLSQKALLLLDYAPTYPGEDELRSGDIFVKFLQPNVINAMHPMIQAPIETLKRKYRRALLSRIEEVNDIKHIMEILKEINIKDVIYMTSTAWEEITTKTLISSWKNLYLFIPGQDQDNADENEKNIQNSEFVYIFNKIKGSTKLNEEDISEWINLENSDPGLLSYDEIVDQCSQVSDQEMSSDDDQQPEKGISHTEATLMFNKLLLYLEQQDETSPSELLVLNQLRDRAARKQHSD